MGFVHFTCYIVFIPLSGDGTTREPQSVLLCPLAEFLSMGVAEQMV